MALCEKILIVGFSGAGKSSLVNSLRVHPPEDWELFDDLDDLVLKSRGKGLKSISQLIEAHGWEQFRLWERQELEGWLKEEGKGVLALGGGALSPLLLELYGKSRKIQFCHLEVPFDLAWERLLGDQQNIRPLTQLGKAHMRELFEQRSQLFSLIPLKIDGTRSVSLVREEFLKKGCLIENA